MSEKSMRLRIEKIKAELTTMGDMRPGSLSEHFKVCGNASCSCRNPAEPKRHGPYMQLNYTHKGRSHTEFVRKDQLDELHLQLDNYARFRNLVDEWIELSIEIARQKRRPAVRRTEKGAQ